MHLPRQILYLKIYLFNFLERFTTLGLKSFIVIYLMTVKQFDSEDAVTVLSIFFFWEYFFSVFIAKYVDQYANDRKAIFVCFLLGILGSFLLFSGDVNRIYLAMSMLVFAAALAKTALPNFLKNVIRCSKNKNYDQKYLIQHMGTNIAVIISPLLLGYYLEELLTFQMMSTLLVATIFGLLASITLLKRQDLKSLKANAVFGLFVCVSLSIIYGSYLWAEYFLYFSSVILLFIVGKIIFFYRSQSAIRQENLWKIFTVLLFLFVFFLFYIQMLSNLIVIIETHTDLYIGTFEVPTPWFISFSAIAVVIFSSLKAKLNPTYSTLKSIFIAARIEILAALFLAFILLTYTLIPVWAIAVFYVALCYAEVHVAPIAISYVAQKSPAKNSSFYAALPPLCVAFMSYVNVFLSQALFDNPSDLVRNFSFFLIATSVVLMGMIFFFRKRDLT